MTETRHNLTVDQDAHVLVDGARPAMVYRYLGLTAVFGIYFLSFFNTPLVRNPDLPGNGKHGDENVSARLRVVVQVSCDCNCYYKWRQRYTEKEIGPHGTHVNYDGKLDIGKRNAEKDGEWYDDFSIDRPDIPHSSDCAYTFSDQPTQNNGGLYLRPENPDRIDKVTLEFTLEFVKVKFRSAKNGGVVLNTIKWGFWYTATENDIY